MPKVVYSPAVGGFQPERDLMELLYQHHPEFFEGPFTPADFAVDVPDLEVRLREVLPGAVLRDGALFILDSTSREFRTSPWLHAQLAATPQCALRFDNPVRTVEVAEGRPWFLFVDDDGSEAVLVGSTHR